MLFMITRSSLIVFPQRELQTFATSVLDSSLVRSKADFNESRESTMVACLLLPTNMVEIIFPVVTKLFGNHL